MKKLDCYMSSTHMACKDDWIACLEQAKRMGFAGVELFGGEGGVPFEDMSEDRCAEIARRAAELGIAISAHPWVNWERLPEDELISRYRALIDRCIRMGMKEINMHLHFLADRDQGMPRVFAATDPCIGLLEKAGVTLLYENVPEHGRRELGSEVKDFAELFAHYGPETPVMLNIDSGHAHIMGQTDALAAFGPRWRYTHINDNDGLSDLHVAPGAGTLGFVAFAQAAKQADYTGPLMMEYSSAALAAGMPVLAKAYAKAGYALTPVAPIAPAD